MNAETASLIEKDLSTSFKESDIHTCGIYRSEELSEAEILRKFSYVCHFCFRSVQITRMIGHFALTLVSFYLPIIIAKLQIGLKY